MPEDYKYCKSIKKDEWTEGIDLKWGHRHSKHGKTWTEKLITCMPWEKNKDGNDKMDQDAASKRFHLVEESLDLNVVSILTVSIYVN